MNIDASRVNARRYVISAIFAGVGAVIILICIWQYGPGLTHDSAAYIHAAENLLAGKRMAYFAYGTPFVQWPPLLPMLIAFFGLAGIAPVHAAALINISAFCLIVFFSGIWLFKNLRNLALIVAGQTSVLFSVPLIYVCEYAWSEGLFILFTVLFLMKSADFLGHGRKRDLVLMAVFAGLSALTRYMGMVSVIVGLFLIVFVYRHRFAVKLANAATFGFISCLPLGLWMLRNYLVFSTLTGVRASSITSLRDNIKMFCMTVLRWFISSPPGTLRAMLKIYGLIVFLMGLAAILVARKYIKRKKAAALGEGLEELDEMKGRLRYMLYAVIPLFLFTCLYTAYLLYSTSTVALDRIDNRLTSPIYVPLMLMLFLAADAAYGFILKDKKLFLKIIPVVLAWLWLVHPFRSALEVTAMSAKNGAGGFTSPKWRNSTMIAYLREDRPDGLVFSNFAEAIYLLVGISVRSLPNNKAVIKEYGFESFKKAMEASGNQGYIVWFGQKTGEDFQHKHSDIVSSYILKPVAENKEGIIYLVEGKR